jgi:hypothetical protein
LTQDQGLSAGARPIAVRWEVWALLCGAAVAVGMGTIARGMIGVPEWVFNTENLSSALPLALPFLVAAGVMAGMGRWPAAKAWLATGAALIALSGAFAVAMDVTFSLMVTGTGIEGTNGWLPIVGTLLGASSAIGYSVLAIGIWRSVSWAWGGLRAAAAVGVGLIVMLAAAGPVVTTALTLDGTSAFPYVLTTGLTTASIAAPGALAVAAIRATPARTPLPELFIAAGATIHAVIYGGWWWVLGTTGPDGVGSLWLTLANPLSYAALLAIALGFASGALFWPAED